MGNKIICILLFSLFVFSVSLVSANADIHNEKFYIDGQEFLIKGVDYAPWLLTTGPNPHIHEPFPDENEDVTGLVSNGGISVTDYNHNGRIEAWEVVQYDLEIMKRVGANTIRTYATGVWHDKNLNGRIDRSSIPEEDEILQGDLPDWVVRRIINFAEDNGMKVILGYWIQEEDFVDENPNEEGYQFECDWDDLEVAKDTMRRVVEEYGDSSAIIAWAIGNEVLGSWNSAWFTWTVSRHDYLNRLYSYVKSIDHRKRPIIYSKYVGEEFDFINLPNVDVIAINTFTHSADELGNEFRIPAPQGKAYMLGEFGHDIEDAEGHWNLSKQHAGGCFLEYNDVWWKYYPNFFGIVDAKRKIKHERYDVLKGLYGQSIAFTIPLSQGWNLISFPLDLEDKSVKSIFGSSVFSMSNGKWLYYFDDGNNNFDTINPAYGFWFYSNSSYLAVYGTMFTSLNFDISPGWNLISYPSIHERDITVVFANVFDDINAVYSFENNEWKSFVPGRADNSLKTMKPGYGYWIKAKSNAVWTFDGSVFH